MYLLVSNPYNIYKCCDLDRERDMMSSFHVYIRIWSQNAHDQKSLRFLLYFFFKLLEAGTGGAVRNEMS